MGAPIFGKRPPPIVFNFLLGQSGPRSYIKNYYHKNRASTTNQNTRQQIISSIYQEHCAVLIQCEVDIVKFRREVSNNKLIPREFASIFIFCINFVVWSFVLYNIQKLPAVLSLLFLSKHLYILTLFNGKYSIRERFASLLSLLRILTGTGFLTVFSLTVCLTNRKCAHTFLDFFFNSFYI